MTLGILVGRSAITGIGIGTTTLSSSLLSSRAPLRLAFSSSLSSLSYHQPRIPQIARTRLARLARPLYTYSGQLRSMNIIHPSKDGLDRDYAPISDHGLIGNLRTAALISLDGSVESYCIPNFDSPSVFARILDKDKGGHFSITPTIPFTSKQNYLPSTNILQTKFMNDRGVVSVTDFLPRPPLHASASTSITPLLPWLIRRIECVRGSLPLIVQCAPAFNYARDSHVLTIVEDDSVPFGKQEKAVFESANLSLDLRYTLESLSHDTPLPTLSLLPHDLSSKGHKGLGVKAELELVEGQVVTFVLRTPPTGYTRAAPLSTGSSASSQSPTPPQLDSSDQAKEAKETQQAMEPMVTTTSTGLTLPALPEHESKEKEMQARAKAEHSKDVRREEAGIVSAGDVRLLSSLPRGRGLDDPFLTSELIHSLLETTSRYWYDWIRQSTYKGSWKEAVHRSALALKLLIYEPTGAVVASPTFSLPEFIGGVRNWDYRASWIRDSSFTLYALIRLGFTEEANSYLEFIFERLRHKNPDGSLNIMYTIHGGKDFPEAELTHLDGHKGSKPVRIGNGAIDHIQLDIYGELMDCIYLGQKYGKPLSYDDWVLVRELVDFVVAHYQDPDLSIWEVRDKMRHFTYSKIMMWVALDRGIRLADKRSLPCPNRYKWLEARDALYEDIMHKAWNSDGKFFGQSYEDKDIVDAAVLIMPLVFFMQASDPRFVSTLKQILKSPERGGLTSNNLVYRYDTSKTEDGVGGDEGTFCLCTLWCVEALTRAGATDRALLKKGVTMFEDFLLYLNHVGLCTEEISPAGEGLGNAVQGFTHVTLISAAYNLSRTLHSAP